MAPNGAALTVTSWGLSDPWQAAARVAERPRDVVGWQRDLAQALAAAAAPDVAAVSLCALGNPGGHSAAVAPREASAMADPLIRRLLPVARAPSLGVVWAVPATSEIPAALETLTLRRSGAITGMLGGFLRSGDGVVAGWIVLFPRAPLDERLHALAAPLADVCRAAERAVQGSLAMAAALGARFPRLPPTALSERELEVARLAASGFSDLNIGARLEISEGTVGRHLHNIYRKLHIGSRMQLCDLRGASGADAR
jgi:DNA-binding CsgD family transcriptional regulator